MGYEIHCSIVGNWHRQWQLMQKAVVEADKLSSPDEIQRAVGQILHDMDKHAKEVEVKMKCQTKGDSLDCVTEVELKF